VAGEIMQKCDMCVGVSMATTDTGSGELTSDQALVANDNPLPYAWAATIKVLMRMSCMEVTGDPAFALPVT